MSSGVGVAGGGCTAKSAKKVRPRLPGPPKVYGPSGVPKDVEVGVRGGVGGGRGQEGEEVRTRAKEDQLETTEARLEGSRGSPQERRWSGRSGDTREEDTGREVLASTRGEGIGGAVRL